MIDMLLGNHDPQHSLNANTYTPVSMQNKTKPPRIMPEAFAYIINPCIDCLVLIAPSKT